MTAVLTTPEVDVLIIGAGLSGIGAARHLGHDLPGKTYTILESRGAIGGTWDLFRYPGIRSDSDMYTLGYSFKPWTGEKSIADGSDIRNYIVETAREAGVDKHIRYHHKVVALEWSSEQQFWTVTAQRSDTDETVTITASFVFSCSGYYNYDKGFSPEFVGQENFGGQVIHPQHWPEDLDYAGKKIVVIGSGATAITLAPNLARDAEHVTLLQRSPSYILSLPSKDPIAQTLRKRLPKKLAYSVTRLKNVSMAMLIFTLSQKYPEFMKKRIRKMQEGWLPKGYDLDTHFTPSYNPWDQRLCLVPDNDLFRSIRKDEVSIVTDHIDSFTETGLKLKSGQHLDADIVVTATGLNLSALGGATFRVDGRDVDLPSTMAYKGMMLTGIPNFAFVVGYTNASWTLKADMVSNYVMRLLAHMDENGYSTVELERDPSVDEEPFLDFAAGYVLRAVDNFPRQGSETPWKLRMNYFRDLPVLRYGKLVDKAMKFGRPRSKVAVAS
ncbi:NAD(P)/FAD-dependent oxidoreductase [Rhodococcus fascians]|nr:NAD(P)/FAD-dependent oxidoreductase [Rhodococcus fascians]MBY3997515.1 NAD(P)/FAD-dependent oxidoreductase [Rhodococcus fascians]MBY4004089.1 NAD(P)/FAD-dependent oxidoreductase [Rhodococcus fascians]MBY4008650.1 NAD(P)/FAD-dependent oxidoreductase [Rhodococcus fascians]MBY4019018.1 NAD(P)/FAD-dependent oxidoreductase [Rhodococcus fascians]